MIVFEPASFKDPAARVFYHRTDVCRTLTADAQATFLALSEAGLLAALERDGLIVSTELVRATDLGLAPGEVGEFVLRQPRVPLVTYPYEWSFEMLRDAALVTLRVLDRALAHGFTLKDGNSFNVVFDGVTPKLVDVPSIETYRDGTVWAGYAQFCRGFLFPLLLAAHRGIDVRPLLRGGLGEISAQETAGFFTLWDRTRPGVLKDVILQSRLDRSFSGSQRDVEAATSRVHYPKAARAASVARLIRIVSALRAPSGNSAWASYETSNSYATADREAKAAYVRRVLGARGFRCLADLGCNAGEYSRLALESCAHVVSLDADAGAIDRLYRTLPTGSPLSPLVVDLLNPTPSMGWALNERRSLFARLECDAFLALGLIHHLRITGGVPLDRIVAQLFEIAGEGIVEWVDKRDAMVARMLSLRPDVYADYTWETFERLLRERGEILSVESTHAGARRLCHVRAREPGAHA